MPKTINWNTRSIFITSTFRDMQAERDHLRAFVFPVLEERLRERFHHLETIDLRWGVESLEEGDLATREMLVLKVCLNEIERARPFLIAILGDRYGWIPPVESMHAAAVEAGFAGDLTGKSVTELEVLYGVLEAGDQRKRCWFYFRKSLDYANMPPEVAAQYCESYTGDDDSALKEENLKLLKKRLKTELSDRVRSYQVEWDKYNHKVIGLEKWGDQVLEDLWSDLECETEAFLSEAPTIWQAQEKLALEEFVEGRIRGFVGREEIINELMDFSMSAPEDNANWGVCVTGDAGTGKSSLFGYMYRELYKNDDLIVLGHAAGTSINSTSVDSMLRRWIYALAKILDQDDPVEEKSSDEDVKNAFCSLLHEASSLKRVVVMIDALNQFSPTTSAKHLTWLPELWPSNARLIATAISCTASDAFINRSYCKKAKMPLLKLDEASIIVQTVCARYHRTLNDEVSDIILAKQTQDDEKAVGNALWLELAVEELNLLDADDFARGERDFEEITDPEMRLLALLKDTANKMPPDVSGLYNAMIDRAEKMFGKSWTQSFVNLIAISRSGWRESDLEILMPVLSGEAWDPLKFATLRRGFRAHVIQRGAESQWDFFHPQMRFTVAERMERECVAPASIHTTIADHLEKLSGEIDVMRQNELMYHLIGTGNGLRTATFYGGEIHDVEISAASKALAQHIVNLIDTGIAYAISLISHEQLSAHLLGKVCHRYVFDLATALENQINLKKLDVLFTATHESLSLLVSLDSSNPGLQRDLSVCLGRKGNIQSDRGDLAGALVSYRALLEICKHLVSHNPRNTGLQRDLSVGFLKIGDVQSSQGDLTGALVSYRASFQIVERLAYLDPANAIWQQDLAISFSRIGFVQSDQGDLAGALVSFRASHEITERISVLDPGDAGVLGNLSVSFINIGDVQSSQGDLAGTAVSYGDSLEIRKRRTFLDPGNAGWQRDVSFILIKIGGVQSSQGDLIGALDSYRVSHKITERLTLLDPGNAGWQRDLSVSFNKVGEVQSSQSDLLRALASFRASLAIRERLAVLDIDNTGLQRDLSLSFIKIGQVQSSQGDLAGALVSFRASHEIRERLVSLDRGNTGWQCDLSISFEKIGDIQGGQGDLAGALESYRASLEIRDRLSILDPSNAQWQRYLAINFEKIGEIQSRQSDLHGALESYRASFKITECLATDDTDNTQLQRDVGACRCYIAIVLQKMGDLSGALDAYELYRDVMQRLVSLHPENALWKRDLSVSITKIGGLQCIQGDTSGALASYRASLEIFECLSSQDPENADRQFDLSVNYKKIGDVQGIQGDLVAASHSYGASLKICVRLADLDPSNAQWVREMSIVCIKSGDVQRRRGDLTGALAAYRGSLEVFKILASQGPEDAAKQLDLSVSYKKIGDVHIIQKDLVSALQSYNASLEICKRLVSLDPSNAQWVRELSIMFIKAGDVQRSQDDLTAALVSYRASFEISERLASQDPSNAGLQFEVGISHERIGSVLLMQGSLKDALFAFQQKQEIINRLASQDPNNAGWQRDMAVSYYKLGTCYYQAKDTTRANIYWGKCLNKLREMRKNEMQLDPQLLKVFEELESMGLIKE